MPSAYVVSREERSEDISHLARNIHGLSLTYTTTIHLHCRGQTNLNTMKPRHTYIIIIISETTIYEYHWEQIKIVGVIYHFPCPVRRMFDREIKWVLVVKIDILRSPQWAMRWMYANDSDIPPHIMVTECLMRFNFKAQHIETAGYMYCIIACHVEMYIHITDK